VAAAVATAGEPSSNDSSFDEAACSKGRAAFAILLVGFADFWSVAFGHRRADLWE
jgi:hypothetical protein